MMKHFLHISDYTTEELWEIMKLAKSVKKKFRAREDYPHFKNKSLAMIFAKVVFPNPGGPYKMT